MEGVDQLIASQYLAALIIGFVNSAPIQPVVAIERTIFYRYWLTTSHSQTLGNLRVALPTPKSSHFLFSSDLQRSNRHIVMSRLKLSEVQLCCQ